MRNVNLWLKMSSPKLYIIQNRAVNFSLSKWLLLWKMTRKEKRGKERKIRRIVMRQKDVNPNKRYFYKATIAWKKSMISLIIWTKRKKKFLNLNRKNFRVISFMTRKAFDKNIKIFQIFFFFLFFLECSLTTFTVVVIFFFFFLNETIR